MCTTAKRGASAQSATVKFWIGVSPDEESRATVYQTLFFIAVTGGPSLRVGRVFGESLSQSDSGEVDDVKCGTLVRVVLCTAKASRQAGVNQKLEAK